MFQRGYPMPLSKGLPEVMNELQFILAGPQVRARAEEAEELLRDLNNAVHSAANTVNTLASAMQCTRSDTKLHDAKENASDSRLQVRSVLSVKPDKPGGGCTVEMELSLGDLCRFVDMLVTRERGHRCTQPAFRSGDRRFASTWPISRRHLQAPGIARSSYCQKAHLAIQPRRFDDSQQHQSQEASGSGSASMSWPGRLAAIVAAVFGLKTASSLVTSRRFSNFDASLALGKLPPALINNLVACCH
ncbi:hypothetical protein GGI12_000947 [Dipsacomyces acuminosporus]|nr:hypothetical protein GGI12_000947 [Dipsacomyces acuminosporus]